MDKNFYIMELKERKEASIPEFEEVKDKVKEAYIKDESTKMAEKKAKECLEKLKTGDNFEKAAGEIGLKIGSTDNFKYGSYIEGIGASDQLWIAAKQLKDDETSEILNLPSGFFIIKIRARIPIDEEKFKEEKTDFEEKLLSQKKQYVFAQFVNELKRKAF